MFKISNLEFAKNEFLTLFNFSIGSTFPKGQGSVFLDSPGSSLGPLYKVCRPELYSKPSQLFKMQFFVKAITILKYY